MYYKCELLVGDKAYDVTNDLVNWDEVEVSLVRNDYDGVVRSFTNKFEFAGGAYLVLTDEYRKNYLQAKAMIVYSSRNNSWLWNERFRCALDFSTFSYDTNTCEINAVDDSLASLIKAKKGTEYEYSVDVIKEGMRLKYDRMQLKAQVTWIPAKEDSDERQDIYVYKTLEYLNIPMILLNDGEALNASEFMEYPNISYRTFVDFIANKTVRILIEFDVESNGVDGDGTLIILKETKKDNDAYMKNLKQSAAYNGKGKTHISWDITHTFEEGYGLAIGLTVVSGNNNTVTISNFKQCAISWDYRGTSIDIDVVKPLTLLNRLLQSMNGGVEGITGEIAASEDGRLENTVLVAADSVRGISGAKLYTSYNKFLEWMEAEFGFVPVVDDTAKKVTFVHRDTLFRDEKVKDLGDECTDFEFRVNESLIYSRVRVGYDKQDYDSVNGRDEWRFTNDYSTGVTLTDNVLELISPYRADVYGMEFLAVKRGEETTDDESDNDVFMVGVVQEGENYVPERGGKYELEGVISKETMFNAMYSQQFMIRANRKFIGVSAEKLERTSAEGNGEVTVGGVREDADVLLPDRLFTVGELSVKTGDMQVPEDLSGYVTLRAGGVDYKGYVTDVSYKYGREEAVEYEIVVSGE